MHSNTPVFNHLRVSTQHNMQSGDGNKKIARKSQTNIREIGTETDCIRISNKTSSARHRDYRMCPCVRVCVCVCVCERERDMGECKRQMESYIRISRAVPTLLCYERHIRGERKRGKIYGQPEDNESKD